MDIEKYENMMIQKYIKNVFSINESIKYDDDQ